MQRRCRVAYGAEQVQRCGASKIVEVKKCRAGAECRGADVQ